VLGVAVLASVFSGAGGFESGDAFIAGLDPALLVGAAVLAVGAITALFVPGRKAASAGVAVPVPA
jgi:hypothetical protein